MKGKTVFSDILKKYMDFLSFTQGDAEAIHYFIVTVAFISVNVWSIWCPLTTRCVYITLLSENANNGNGTHC